MNKFVLVLGALAGLSLAACGGKSCEDVCQGYSECGGDAAVDECVTETCEANQEMAEEAGCTAEFDAIVACAADLDVCESDPIGSCPEEVGDYSECLMAAATDG